jgi:hypothetical protein
MPDNLQSIPLAANATFVSQCACAQKDVCMQGFVYLQFQSTEGAAAAQKALHGRWFAGRQIVAEFQFAPIYSQYFRV